MRQDSLVVTSRFVAQIRTRPVPAHASLAVFLTKADGYQALKVRHVNP